MVQPKCSQEDRAGRTFGLFSLGFPTYNLDTGEIKHFKSGKFDNC